MRIRQFPTLLNAPLFLVLCSLGFNAGALQMGPLDSHSKLGEPLQATVGLWLNSAEKSRTVRFTVSPDLAYRRNTGITEIVNQIETRLERTANGNVFFSMRTESPVTEPIVAFRLKITIGDNAIMRNFSVALNPTPSQSQTKVATQAATKSSSKKLDAIDGPTYFVSNGDTLWGIARRITRSNTANKVQEIFAANPNAFINGDQNKLKLGAKLILSQLPAANAQQLESVAPQTSVAEKISVVEDIAVKPQSTAARTDRVATRSPEVDWKLRKPEVAAELAALDEKYAALKYRFSAQSMAPTEVGTSVASENKMTATLPATKDVREPVNSPSATTTARPSEKILQSEPPQLNSINSTVGADQNVTNEDIDIATTSRMFDWVLSSTSRLYSLFIVLAICSIALLGFMARKELRTLGNRRSEHNFKAQKQARRAEVTRKASSRIENESKASEVIEPRDDDNAMRTSGGASPVQIADIKEADIDINIAHGRYNEAEKSLVDVIAAAPRNYSAKLRLIEVYYMTERVSEFCALADELQNNHREDMADDEWRRVIRMGKIIAPDEVRFSGPRAVENASRSA